MTSSHASGKYGGYPLEKTRSYTIESTPLDDALGSKVPLFIANGTRDVKAPASGADLFAVEVLRKQPKRLVHYVNYPDLDHDFTDASDKDHSEEVFSQFIEWAMSSKKARDFEIHSLVPSSSSSTH